MSYIGAANFLERVRVQTRTRRKVAASMYDVLEAVDTVNVLVMMGMESILKM